jgi:hypothetical protein
VSSESEFRKIVKWQGTVDFYVFHLFLMIFVQKTIKFETGALCLGAAPIITYAFIISIIPFETFAK